MSSYGKDRFATALPIGASKPSRDNHYVPVWYQRRFLEPGERKLHRLDLTPDDIVLPDGTTKKYNARKILPPKSCFWAYDLYSTFLGPFVSDEIERRLFGQIDDRGARAVDAVVRNDISAIHDLFNDFFYYLDAQKLRTPKGLSWIRAHYRDITQNELLFEMQAIRNLHCTIWAESVREIVDASDSDVKFILSDNPVTIYNPALAPGVQECIFPHDPSIALKGTQTIFPLDRDHCIIFTNYERATESDCDLIARRANARNFGNSLVRIDNFLHGRKLNAEDVSKINSIIKSRATRYIAAGKEEWLFPEHRTDGDWKEWGECLLPNKDGLWHYGGEMFIGFEDGHSEYSDAFGRRAPESTYLKKKKSDEPLAPNDRCGCGYGRLYKDCCLNKPLHLRPTWDYLSIRDRNIAFFNAITDILSLEPESDWGALRANITDEKIKRLHEIHQALWPQDTDILALLPKPDGLFRAVYTGLIDPRTIMAFAPGMAPYFDEIIVQSPFVSPFNVRPDYSPTVNPGMFREQTLKNIHLFLQLMPLIDAGKILFIPDICAFNGGLQKQVMELAESRRKNFDVNPQERTLFMQLHEEDSKRDLLSMPRDYRRRQAKKALPDLSDKDMEELLDHMEQQRDEDPFATPERPLDENWGKFRIMTLAPNFEVAMLLCQLTGAVFYTDSPTRWAEISAAAARCGPQEGARIARAIASENFPTTYNTVESLYLSKTEQCAEVRNILREAQACIVKPDINERTILKDVIVPRFPSAMDQVRVEAGLSARRFGGNTVIINKLDVTICPRGITHRHVERLMIANGFTPTGFPVISMHLRKQRLKTKLK